MMISGKVSADIGVHPGRLRSGCKYCIRTETDFFGRECAAEMQLQIQKVARKMDIDLPMRSSQDSCGEGARPDVSIGSKGKLLTPSN
jgi:hypothetical protein